MWTPEPQRQKRSTICITARRGKPIQIQPDPAVVPVGDTVIWQLRYFDSDDPIQMTVYFDHGTPFKNWRSRSVETKQKDKEQRDDKHDGEKQQEGGVSEGTIDGGKADETGDYKYGVRLLNARTKVPLSDDDPWLKVIPAGKSAIAG
jgi:hypothetical protein